MPISTYHTNNAKNEPYTPSGHTKNEVSTPSSDTRNAFSSPLTWQAPSHRVNGQLIKQGELVSYEIWAGYSPDSLFWIYTYTPPRSAPPEMQLNIAALLQSKQTHQLGYAQDKTLFFGVIAVDSDNKRSMMSELKAIKVNF